MPETREQIAARGEQLRRVVGDMFDVFEQVRAMFHNWDDGCHRPFIHQVMRLQRLEAELYTLGHDETFVLTVKQAVYQSVFPEPEQAKIHEPSSF